MSTFLKVVKIILTVLGWSLLILLIFPVRLDLLLQDSVLTADLRYIFLKFRLSPSEKGKKEDPSESVQKDVAEDVERDEAAVQEPQAENPEEPKENSGAEDRTAEDEPKTGNGGTEDPTDEDEDEDTDKKESLGDTIRKIIRFAEPLLKPGYWLLRKLFGAIHVDNVSVVVSVTGSDPASIGFRSGLWWALLGDLMHLLALLFGKNVTYSEVTVLPCFGETKPVKEKIGCSVSACPLIIILLALGFGLGYLFELVRNLIKRGGKKNVN